MKFRVSGKDFTIFIIFAIFLFYLCCLVTSNVHQLSVDGSFSGLNPIPGLTEFFGATILLFIVFVVLIIASSSSYIFERKKGIGFEIGEKQEKGYSRWSKDKEIKNDKGVEIVDPLDQETKYAGIPLVNDGKRLWVDNGEYHNLVIGATGSGKSQTVVEPMVELLIKKGESMIITDPKGELYKAGSEYMRERGYNVVLLNFREPQNGNAWNPLTLPYQYYKDGNKDKATELLDDVALNILYDPNNKGEPFWEKSAADYFSGLALGLFEDAKPEQINLSSINYMSTVGEDKFAAGTFIKEYFTLKGESSNAYVFASNTINAPQDTKGSILSVFRQKIRLFASRENLSEMLAYSDFDMRNIGKEKTAVFIVIQDEKTTYHSLATIFIKQCYETLIDVAQTNGGKLPYRTNFILDEFANMPPLQDVTSMVTAARSRDIRFTFIIQNFAQLKSVYGNENAETIKGNCGNLVYLISTELAALEEISKMCGEVKSSDKDKTASTPLVTVTDLQKLKLFEAIIIRWRMSPFKTKYTPNFKMDWGHEKIEAVYPVRQEKEISYFDVKEFVKEKKRQNMLKSLDGDGSKPAGGGMSPFGGSPASPFGGNSASPFGGSSPFGVSPSPFGGSDFDAPKKDNDSGLFGGLGGGIDLDAMMKDIDRKIAELDAEEARQKEELAKKKKEEEEANKKVEAVDVSSSKIDLETTATDLPKLTTAPLDYDKKEEVVETKKEQSSIFDEELLFNKEEVKETKKDNNEETYNIFNTMPSIKLDEEPKNKTNDKVNFAVATSSPAEDFEFDLLPKVEDADVLTPSYASGSVVKAEESYNIYDTIPDIMSTVKDDVKDSEVIKKEVDDFVDTLPKVETKKEAEYETLDFTTSIKPVVEEKVEEKKEDKKEEKANVNIDADDVYIDSSVITDDQFFDDFFGDD
ncbi:MAG: VirD4-like conjugal transfer protein, CD1115 family [Candidatus Coprovivens sp.]